MKKISLFALWTVLAAAFIIGTVAVTHYIGDRSTASGYPGDGNR